MIRPRQLIWPPAGVTMALCSSVALGAVLIGVSTVFVPVYVPALLLGATALALVLLAKPSLAIAVLLFVRPLLDALREEYVPGPLEGVLNPAGVVTLAIAAAIAFHLLHGRFTIFVYSVSAPYATFLGCCAVSVLLSPSIVAGIGDLVRFVSYFLLYLVIREIAKSPEMVERLAATAVLSGVIPVAVGLHQVATGQVSVGHGIPQIRSIFAHMNGYGIFLVVIGLPALVMVISESSRRRKLPCGVLTLLICFSLLRTYSRVAWVGFAVGVIVIAVARYRRVLALFPLCVLLVWLDPNILARWRLILGPTPEQNSLLSRLIIWRDAMSLFRSSPFVGVGLRSFNVLSSYLAAQYTAFQGVQVHSTYVQLLAETGILGLGTFLWIQLVLTKEAVWAVRLVKARQFQPAVLGFAAILAATLVMGLTDNLVSSPVIQWYLWAFGGLAGSALALQQSSATSCHLTPDNRQGIHTQSGHSIHAQSGPPTVAELLQ